jgi:hypothetical protein
MFLVALAEVCAGGCYRPVTELGPGCEFNQASSILCLNFLAAKDAANTKTAFDGSFDGWYVTLYIIALSKGQIVLQDHVK